MTNTERINEIASRHNTEVGDDPEFDELVKLALGIAEELEMERKGRGLVIESYATENRKLGKALNEVLDALEYDPEYGSCGGLTMDTENFKDEWSKLARGEEAV